MRVSFRISLLLLGAVLAGPAARAQFTGNFALTPPAGQTYMSSTSAGAWSYSASGTGSTVFDTSGAPDSLVLFAEAVDLSGSSTSSLSITSLEAGTLSFDYSLTISTGGTYTPTSGSFTYQLNSNLTTLTADATSTVHWNVEPGDNILFITTAHGGQDSIFIDPPGPGLIPIPASGDASVTISNFSFTPATVPEPADFALGAGLMAVGLAAWPRRRK